MLLKSTPHTRSPANLVSDQQTTLLADRNVTITSAASSLNTTNFEAHRTSGLTLDGPSLFIGSKSNSNDLKAQSTTQVGSNVASLEGNVTIIAGGKATVQASNLIAPGTVVDGKVTGGNISVIAKSIDILDAPNTNAQQTESKTRQSGLSISIGSPLISAVQTIASTAEAVSNTKSGRMQALGVAGAGLSLYNNAGSTKKAIDDIAGGKALDAFTLSASLGTSKSQSNSATNSTTSAGSTLAAGGNLTLSATGDGKSSNLTIAGSQVLADGNVTLTADNAVNLIAGVNTTNETNSNKSSSASVGVSYNPVSGFGFNAAASRSKGQGAGDGTSFTNTTTAAGNNLTITSGGNTNLIGATAAGKQVTVDVGKTFGGNLTVESLQDKSTYNESSRSSGGSISIGGGSTFGGSVSAGNTKINSNFASVNEQSKISAGDGGFTVNVQGNTTLTGGQITSTQKAVDSKANSFQSGGNVTITDINNTAVYNASGYSLTAGFSVGKDNETGNSKTTPIGSAGVGSSSGNAASITIGGISGIAGNKDVRTGDAQTGLAPIFNRDEVRADNNAQITITAQFGSNASKAWGTYADDKQSKATTAEDKACWQEGGSCRAAGHVLIGGLTGGAGGALGAGAVSIGAPVLNDLQGRFTSGLVALGVNPNVAQGISGMATGGLATAIGTAAGGASGGAAAGNADFNNRQLHPTETLWIRNNSRDYARQLCGCNNPSAAQITAAEGSLMRQAARQNDATWAVYLGPTADTSAAGFLASANNGLQPSYFVNERGQYQPLFTTMPGQYASAMNGATSAANDPLTMSMYQQHLQPTAAGNSAIVGLGRLGAQTGLNLIRDSSTGVLRLVTGNSSPPSVTDFATGTGNAVAGAGDNLGSGAAGLTNSGSALLTNLYGRNDAATVSGIVSVIPAAAMVTAVPGTVRAVGSVAANGSRVVGAVGENFVRVLGADGVAITVARVDAATLPAGYTLAPDGVNIAGPRGGQMQVTGWLSPDGRPVLQQGSSYFTLAPDGTRANVQAPHLGSNIEANAARGNAFQTDALAASGVSPNTSRMTFANPAGGSYTIVPDGQRGGWLIETKDVQSIGMTNQWRGYEASTQPIQLIVSPNTQSIAPQVMNIIRQSGGNIRIYDPATRTFTPWTR